MKDNQHKVNRSSLPPLVGTLDEQLVIQRQRNKIMFRRNAERLEANRLFLKWFGWFDRLLGGEMRYQTDRLIRVNAELHEIDKQIEETIVKRSIA
jgi:transposase